MASMPKTLAGIGMSIDEWDANRQARGFENVLTAVKPFLVYTEPNLDIIPILHGTRLQVTDVSQPVNEVPKKVYMRVGPGMECHIEADVVEEFTAPAGLAVSQIRSGNRHLLGSSIPSEVKKQRKTLTDSDPQPLEVRILVDAIQVVLMDGSVGTFSAGHVVDVCASSHVENFCVIRFEDNRIAPMWRSQLEKISQLKVEGHVPLMDYFPLWHLNSVHRTEHTLLVAHKEAYGLGHLGHLFPIEKGAKVLLTAKSHNVGYFVDTSSNVFVLTEQQIKESLFDMTAEESILQAAERAGVKKLYSEWGGWKTHRHHNDRVAPGTTTVSSLIEGNISREQIANLPRNSEGFPLPPFDSSPPQDGTGELSIQFGYYDFASDADADLSWSHDFGLAGDVVWAANRGEEGLSDIKLKWVPGTLEGTQAPFGTCNAYVMITIINDMRLWHFGKGPVPYDELPIFTGLDEFWHEREGANVDSIHKLASIDPSARPLLSEIAIEGQMYDRQGYVARALRRASPQQNLNPNALPRAAQLQQEILRASDRSWQFGQRLAVPHVDESAPRIERTSTHPYFVDTSYHKSMPDVLYLFDKETTRYAGVFTLGKKRLAAMDLNLPLLNAYGEAKSTIVKSQGKSTVEVLLRDIPFAPTRIASNEWGPVMGTIYTLGFGFGTGGSGGWAEIVARMPYITRTYCSWYRDNWTDTSRRYRLVPDKILNTKSSKRMDNVIRDNPMSPLFQANNTLRGIASGLVDPAKPYGKPVKDVAGYWHAANLVLFAFNDPSEKHPVDRFRELNNGPSSRERRILEARKKKIKEQTEAAQNAPVAVDEGDNDGKHEER